MGVWKIYSLCSYSVSKHSTILSIDKINNVVDKCLFIIVQKIRKNGMRKKTDTRNLKSSVAFFFYFCCTLDFCASSTTGISIYSGTIYGKLVLNWNGGMKDLFFVRLHTSYFVSKPSCPLNKINNTYLGLKFEFLKSLFIVQRIRKNRMRKKAGTQNLKKMLRVTIMPNLPELDVHWVC